MADGRKRNGRKNTNRNFGNRWTGSTGGMAGPAPLTPEGLARRREWVREHTERRWRIEGNEREK